MALPVTQPEGLAVRAINLALAKIGVSKTISSLADQTREALTGTLEFNHQFKACLRQHPWPFATKYATLALVAGTSAAPVNGDWQYAYAYPTDCLFARRIVPPGTTGVDLFGVTVGNQSGAAATGRQFAESPAGTGYRSNPTPFRVGRHGDQLVLFCNHTNNLTTPVIDLEYTALFVCPEEIVDELFMDALSWRMASAMAPALSRIDRMAARAWQMYLHTLDTAAAVSVKEQQELAHGEAEWIRTRE